MYPLSCTQAQTTCAAPDCSSWVRRESLCFIPPPHNCTICDFARLLLCVPDHVSDRLWPDGVITTTLMCGSHSFCQVEGDGTGYFQHLILNMYTGISIVRSVVFSIPQVHVVNSVYIQWLGKDSGPPPGHRYAHHLRWGHIWALGAWPVFSATPAYGRV